MFKLNGTPIPIDVPFTDPATGVQYPANWLRLSTPQDKAAIGITEESGPVQVDQRYYWSVGNPRPLADVKAARVAEIKAQAFSLLTRTDWEVTRATEVPPQGQALTDYQSLQTMRTAIRTNSNNAEAAIDACADVAAVAAIPNANLAPEGYLPEMPHL